MEPVAVSVKLPSLKIGNKRMKRGGAGNSGSICVADVVFSRPL